jgi:hypothetical protein
MKKIMKDLEQEFYRQASDVIFGALYGVIILDVDLARCELRRSRHKVAGI